MPNEGTIKWSIGVYSGTESWYDSRDGANPSWTSLQYMKSLSTIIKKRRNLHSIRQMSGVVEILFNIFKCSMTTENIVNFAKALKDYDHFHTCLDSIQKTTDVSRIIDTHNVYCRLDDFIKQYANDDVYQLWSNIIKYYQPRQFTLEELGIPPMRWLSTILTIKPDTTKHIDQASEWGSLQNSYWSERYRQCAHNN